MSADLAPLAALKQITAVYSSHPTAPLSLLARSALLDSSTFRAMEDDRQAVRIPAMRGSVFLVPRDEAPSILVGTRIPLKKLQGRLEYGGFTWDDYERIKSQFLKVATSPKSADELQNLIPVDGKLMVAIRVLAYEGIALRVGTSLRADSFSYVSADSWLGEPLSQLDPECCQIWLAERYLRAFGPVTTNDFAWWAGLTKTAAKKAVAQLETSEVHDGNMLMSDDLEDWNRCEPVPEDHVALLPKWDAYSMGYPAESRSHFVDEKDNTKAYPKFSATRGDAAPLILRAGKAVARWKHRFTKEHMAVIVVPFDSADPLGWLDESNFEPAGGLLGATRVSLSRAIE